MNQKQLIKKCLISDDAIATNPFTDKRYSEITIIRHKSNEKWFACIFTLENKLYVNLKCEPELAAILRDNEPAITPAWHMNKKHWIKVDVNAIAPDILEKLITISYNLTAPKRKRNR